MPLKADPTRLVAQMHGGCDSKYFPDLDETPQQVKGNKGCLLAGFVANMTANVLYLQCYDAPASEVTVGTTERRWGLPIPTNGDQNVCGWILPIPVQGEQFLTGITFAVTTTRDGASGPQDDDAVIATFWYK